MAHNALSFSDNAIDIWFAAARAHSPEALGRLLDLSRPYLLSIAAQDRPAAIGAKEGDSDIVQETFVVAYREFAQFHGTTVEEWLAWLKPILRHQLAHSGRRYRTARRSAAREERCDASCGQDAPGDSAPTPVTSLVRRERGQRVREALARLGPHDRDLLLWREVERLSFAEIGRRLGCSDKTACSRRNQAAARCKQELERMKLGDDTSLGAV